jgi:hypothetical protein
MAQPMSNADENQAFRSHAWSLLPVLCFALSIPQGPDGATARQESINFKLQTLPNILNCADRILSIRWLHPILNGHGFQLFGVGDSV